MPITTEYEVMLGDTLIRRLPLMVLHEDIEVEEKAPATKRSCFFCGRKELAWKDYCSHCLPFVEYIAKEA